jgi:hypothetical protein
VECAGASSYLSVCCLFILRGDGMGCLSSIFLLPFLVVVVCRSIAEDVYL